VIKVLAISGETVPRNNLFCHGRLGVAVQLQGCPLSCLNCEHPEYRSVESGQKYDLEALVTKIVLVGQGLQFCYFFGGDLLVQPDAMQLLLNLRGCGFRDIWVETVGSGISGFLEQRASLIPSFIHLVVKPRLSSSGMAEYVDDHLFDRLREEDMLAYRCQTRDDFMEAVQQLRVQKDMAVRRVQFDAQPPLRLRWLRDQLLRSDNPLRQMFDLRINQE